jgi:putative membrane protein
MDFAMPPELQSPEIAAFANGFPLALLQAGVTAVMLVFGAALYALLTPHKEITLIREGNSAAALSFAGVLIGLTIPLCTALTTSTSLLEIGLWGVGAIFVQLLIFRLTDFMLHGLPQRIQDGEMSAAILLFGAKVATALILSAAIAV